MRKTCLLILIFFLGSDLSWAQRTPRYKEAINQAKIKEKDGDFKEARAVLINTIKDADLNQDESRDRLLAQFTLGYLYQQEDDKTRQGSLELLGNAAAQYEAVLAVAPEHRATRMNLAKVYRKQALQLFSESRLSESGVRGSPDLSGVRRYEHFLKESMEKDPGGAGAYAKLLADQYRTSGNWSDALQYYRVVAKEEPGNETSRMGIVSAFASMRGADMNELFQICKKWEDAFPNTAVEGYQTIIMRTHRTGNQAEQALPRLVNLLADQPKLLQRSMDRLPADWASPAFKELTAVMKNPEAAASSLVWWKKSFERRNTLAHLTLALGREYLAKGQAARAEACWKMGIVHGPGSSAYGRSSQGEKYIRLDIQTQLAALYFKFPELDPDGSKLSDVEDTLFDGKSFAYRGNDWAAIFRYHIVLGNIYARRGHWQSSSRYKNGIFQLEGALAARNRINHQKGEHVRLPEVRHLLAGGYKAIDRFSDAYRNYVEAAEEFVLEKNVQAAGESLGQAATLPYRPTQSERDKFSSIRKWISVMRERESNQ